MSLTGINLSGRGYSCDGDDKSHKTMEGGDTVDGLKTLQAYGVSWPILGQCPNSICKYAPESFIYGPIGQ